jgi:hypothetical protein
VSRRVVAGDLSDRDTAILEGLAELAFMSGGQIERRWFLVADVSPVGARRRTQRVLRRLSEQRLVHRLERRSGGTRGGSTAYVYRLDHLGRRMIGLQGRGTQREPSVRFVDHSLAISELAVQLIEAERAKNISDLRCGFEPVIWRRFATAAGIETLKPDLLVELTTPDGWDLRWFVEVDRGTEHLPTVLGKCQLYERYWRSGHEAQLSEVFPRVLWSVPDQRRAARIQEAIARSRGLTDDLFRVQTTDGSLAQLINATDNSKGGQP